MSRGVLSSWIGVTGVRASPRDFLEARVAESSAGVPVAVLLGGVFLSRLQDFVGLCSS